MGLDRVEFVMAVEEEFDISFDDPELSHIRTVGEFRDLVLNELRSKQRVEKADQTARAVCTSSRAFYRFRKALTDSAIARRKDVARNTALASLIPRDNRRAVWSEVAQSMRCRLPELERTLRLIHSGAGAVWWLVLSRIELPILA